MVTWVIGKIQGQANSLHASLNAISRCFSDQWIEELHLCVPAAVGKV